MKDVSNLQIRLKMISIKKLFSLTMILYTACLISNDKSPVKTTDESPVKTPNASPVKTPNASPVKTPNASRKRRSERRRSEQDAKKSAQSAHAKAGGASAGASDGAAGAGLGAGAGAGVGAGSSTDSTTKFEIDVAAFFKNASTGKHYAASALGKLKGTTTTGIKDIAKLLAGLRVKFSDIEEVVDPVRHYTATAIITGNISDEFKPTTNTLDVINLQTIPGSIKPTNVHVYFYDGEKLCATSLSRDETGALVPNTSTRPDAYFIKTGVIEGHVYFRE